MAFMDRFVGKTPGSDLDFYSFSIRAIRQIRGFFLIRHTQLPLAAEFRWDLGTTNRTNRTNLKSEARPKLGETVGVQLPVL
jgi:hypothetical protein